MEDEKEVKLTVEGGRRGSANVPWEGRDGGRKGANPKNEDESATPDFALEHPVADLVEALDSQGPGPYIHELGFRHCQDPSPNVVKDEVKLTPSMFE